MSAGDRRYALTEAAATQQRGARRAARTETNGSVTRRRTKKSEVLRAGRAEEVRAHPVSFVSTLFEIDDI